MPETEELFGRIESRCGGADVGWEPAKEEIREFREERKRLLAERDQILYGYECPPGLSPHRDED